MTPSYWTIRCLIPCVKSAVELIRSNHTFRGKAKFTFELAEDDRIFAVPAEVMMRLDEFLSETAKRVLDGGEYKLTVAAVSKSRRTCVQTDGAEIAFPKSTV